MKSKYTIFGIILLLLCATAVAYFAINEIEFKKSLNPNEKINLKTDENRLRTIKQLIRSEGEFNWQYYNQIKVNSSTWQKQKIYQRNDQLTELLIKFYGDLIEFSLDQKATTALQVVTSASGETYYFHRKSGNVKGDYLQYELSVLDNIYLEQGSDGWYYALVRIPSNSRGGSFQVQKKLIP